MSQKELPEKYYFDYYKIVLNDVYAKYNHLLLPDEQAFLSILLDLSENALCLWIRMVNRVKVYFRDKDLRYKEIDIEAAKIELEENGLLAKFTIYDKNKSAFVALELTKPEIVEILFKVLDERKANLNKLSKDELAQQLSLLCEEREVLNFLVEKEFVFCELKELDLFIKYLYFGFISMDLTPFVVRDLGNVRYEDFEDEMLAPRFENRADIEAAWEIACALQYYHYLKKYKVPTLEIYHWFEEWNRHLKTDDWCDYAKRRYERLVIKMALSLEKAKQTEYALEVYKLSDKPPSRERRSRIYNAIGRKENAINLCLEMRKFPENAQEKYFAHYFLKKLNGEKLLLPTTAYLKKSDKISISKKWKYRPEDGLIAYYMEQGYTALYAENWLWRSLLGLLLWDVIFDSKDSAITSPFQRIPSNFLSKDYYLLREKKIEKAFAVLHKPKKFEQHIKKVFDTKYGTVNPLVFWDEELLTILDLLYISVENEKLIAILRTMISDPANNIKGFPDLAVWDKYGRLRMVEVKAPKDTLSFQQLFWLEFFNEIGIEACAEKVVYDKT